MTIDAQLLSFEPLCRHVARRYFAPGLDHDDLLQEARIGAYKGIRDYQPERGSSLNTFVGHCAERQVITAVKTAQRAKHGPLNTAVTVKRDEDGEWVDALDDLHAGDVTDPLAALTVREELRDLGTKLRERLSDIECGCLVGLANGETYEEIAARYAITPKQVDRALTRAQWKLRGNGPPSAPHLGESRRRGAHGYTCPRCGGATVKKPGRGRPPRCVVCRVVEARAA